MKVVIIGAGRTGRGFVAPIFFNNGCKITFLDNNCDLIKMLNDKKKYTVDYFDQREHAVVIDRYSALFVEDPKAISAIAEADIVTTSVFAQNLSQLGPLLVNGIEERNNYKNKLTIITVENSVNAPDMLKDYNMNADISAGVIFCTSVNSSELDITSEYGLQLPVNAEKISSQFDIDGMPLVENFDTLIRRKIYTYNFMSALISYLGSYKKHEFLDEAATDAEVLIYLNVLKVPHNLALSKYFHIPIESQTNFWEAAYRKFSNSKIKDPIVRNAQQALRKLGKNERLLFPMKLVDQMGDTVWPYIVLIALALHYAFKHENISRSDIQKLIAEMEVKNKYKNEIRSVLLKLKNQCSLRDLYNYYMNP